MTDVRKIPWRLPEGYEDLKAFWDNFIKALGQDIQSSGAAGTSDDTEAMVFFNGD